MENENNNDYDYYLYVYQNKIIKITKTRKIYYTVSYPNVKTYRISVIPKNKTVSDLLYRYGYSLDKEGIYEVVYEKDDKNFEPLKRMNKIITLLEKFESISSFMKSSIVSSTAGDDIYNRILMRQIEEYDKTNTVGNLLEAEFKCSKYETYDSLVEAIKLKYDDASEIFAFIKYKSFEVKTLLKENSFDKVNEIIKEMYQKLRM